MKDNDKPIVEVKTAEDYSIASVIVTFPFLTQAVAFSEICNVILNKMNSVAKVPKS
jgi:hypothetical protein